MSVVSSVGVLPKAVIAALVGTVAGATAGVLSIRQPSATVNVSASPAGSAAVKTVITHSDDRSSAPYVSKPAPETTEPADVMQRARTLARRPDVAALISLRED